MRQMSKIESPQYIGNSPPLRCHSLELKVTQAMISHGFVVILVEWRHRSFGGLGHRTRRNAAGRRPNIEAIEVEVNDRGCEQGQKLAENKAAHHGIAERLAQLRSGAVAE